ncbi:hypothetical protein D6D01_09439 [Aureobasidium pullulans]|uniref:Uncharacterized protein n=1 Tax=Aureobasidium pullulans TaxID=5580 RepID=A0A4S9K591_AURPU|nr:hypothetical protein D6D01_09439 [Aureobasidium pullulans]
MLLESHTFHQGVRKVYKGVQRLRHGPLEEDLGGTDLQKQGLGFANHFWEKIQVQTGCRKRIEDPLQKPDPTQTHTTQAQQPPQQQPSQSSRSSQPSQAAREPQPPKEGFISHFMDVLRSQTRGGNKNR